MTNLADGADSRGQRRREQLVEAALALLADGGWAAVTTRAVAERSGANVGLIHYHFGGLPGLRLAVARRAVDLITGPIVERLAGAADEREALAAIRAALLDTAGDRTIVNLTVELAGGALRDPELGKDLREQTRLARARLAGWLSEIRPQWTPERRAGVATLVMATIDGLALHLMLDPETPAGAALDAVDAMVAALGESR